MSEKLPKFLTEDREFIEGALVMSYWKKPELFDEYPITESDVMLDESKFLITLGAKMYNSGIFIFDEVNVETYFLNNLVDKERIAQYGGVRSVIQQSSTINEEGIEKYYDRTMQLNLITSLYLMQKDNMVNLEKFKSFDSAQDVYDYFELKLEECRNDRVERETDELDGYIDDRMFEAMLNGTFFETIHFNLQTPIISSIVNGAVLGATQLISGLSGHGKSNFVLSNQVYSTLAQGEPVLFISNELSKAQVIQILIVNVLARELKYYKIAKDKLIKTDSEGKSRLTDMDKEMLVKAREWYHANMAHNFFFIANKTASLSPVLRSMKKYKKIGCNLVVYDTCKAEKSSATGWADIIEMSKQLDLEAQKNTQALVLTYQIAPYASNKHYMDRSLLSQGKNIIDITSTHLMLRRLLPDEYPGGGAELKPYRMRKNEVGKWKKEKIENWYDDETCKYVLIFCDKNRFGSESDVVLLKYFGHLGTYHEIGYVNGSVKYDAGN